MAAIPPTVLAWFNATYATVTFNAAWLQECHDYLARHFTLSPQQLIKKIEAQLLLSDLTSSTTHPALPPSLSIHRNTPLSDRPSLLLHAAPRKSGILLQVVALTDITHSALSLEHTHRQRQAQLQAPGTSQVIGLDDVQQQEEDHDGSAISNALKPFPRGMLKLVLSDGVTNVDAIEYKRIPDLSLETTKLGCKLLIKNVQVRRGILLLTPQNTVVKGYHVDELQDLAHVRFQAILDDRLGRQVRVDEDRSTTTTTVKRRSVSRDAPGLQESRPVKRRTPTPTAFAPIVINSDDDDDF